MPAPKTVNWEDGSAARYDTNSMWRNERGVLTDGVYEYDDEGRPLSGGVPGDGPGQWTDGLPGARGGTGPGGGGGGGAAGGSDLTASPYYQQYQSQIQAAQAADLSGMKSQLQQLLIQFGLVPEGFQDKYGALDDTIKQLIQQNTDTGVSQYARLLESKADAQRAAINNLAARGLSRSGAKGYALRRGGLDFNRAQSDALSQVLGQANQLQGGYASREMERQNGLAQLLLQLSQSWRPTVSTGGGRGGYVPAVPNVPQPQPYYESAAGPSPYQPTSTGGVGGNQPGYYQGGALYATKGENDNINPVFWLK